MRPPNVSDIRYHAALATSLAREEDMVSTAAANHADSVAVGRDRAIRRAAHYLAVAAYCDAHAHSQHSPDLPLSDEATTPKRPKVHRARGIFGLSKTCPQCRARAGEPCNFEVGLPRKSPDAPRLGA